MREPRQTEPHIIIDPSGAIFQFESEEDCIFAELAIGAMSKQDLIDFCAGYGINLLENGYLIETWFYRAVEFYARLHSRGQVPLMEPNSALRQQIAATHAREALARISQGRVPL